MSVNNDISKIAEQLATADGQLQHLINKAKIILKLTDSLHSYLSANMSAHCRIGNIDADQLIIQIDNPTMATKLIYLLPNILQHFQQTFPELKFNSIDYFVRPFATTELPKNKQIIKPKPPSQSSAQLLRMVAKNCNHDKLQQILNRIASHSTVQNDINEGINKNE